MRLYVVGLASVVACSFSARSPNQQTPGDGPRDTTGDTMIVPGPDGGPCVAAGSSCASIDVLRSCSAPGASYVDTTCDWGCLGSDATTHCGSFVPTSNGAEATDLVQQPGLDDVTIDGSLDADSGAISGTTTRNQGGGVQAGIGYRTHGNTAIFTAKSFHIGTLQVSGNHAVAFVATSGDITVTGTIDMTGGCAMPFLAGPGGFLGSVVKGFPGASDTLTQKGGGGFASSAATGAGGAGHGGTGGAGDAAAGGMPYGDDAISNLSGGAGGGAGSGGTNFGRGGGGGGAIQLVTAGAIAVQSAAGINAGGCGGGPGTGNADSGGGGGAGGTVLLEARAITISGTLAVNGGGGGGGGGNNARGGGNALLSRTLAAAGAGDASDEKGGSGAAGSNADGFSGDGGNNPGGGGGAIGRMRFNTFRAANLTTTGATLSPDLTDQASTCTSGSAAVQ